MLMKKSMIGRNAPASRTNTPSGCSPPKRATARGEVGPACSVGRVWVIASPTTGYVEITMLPQPVLVHNYALATTYAVCVTSDPRHRRAQANAAPGSTDEQRWADLADLVLMMSRELQFRGYADRRALSLSQSEGMVVRYLLQSGPAAPSQIAAATGLQRTNLSTVLRGLEQKGLIQRQADPSDGRGVTVRATDRGSS